MQDEEYKKLQKACQDLLKLQEITRVITSEFNLKKLLNTIMDAIIEIKNAERGFLILVENGRPVIEVARNIDREAIKKAELKFSRSIALEVMKTGKAIITSDAQEDERFSEVLSIRDLKLRSIVCIPLRSKENVIGALYIDNRFQRGIFLPEDLKLLEAFGSQAAVAIENARLYQENLAKQRELEKKASQVEELNRKLEEKVIRRTHELKLVREDLALVQKELEIRYCYDNIIGRSARMQELFRLLDRIAPSEVPVLVMGDSGTGKELVARAIHFHSPRKNKAFLIQNCGAFSETLLESELFGHVKGSFTGAYSDKKGLFEVADGGTFFLDEIAEMGSSLQVKLLRVLQEGTFIPVGDTKPKKVDVRLIGATNKDLEKLVEKGEFREDLYYRIKVIKITLPPLRDRKEDIPLLIAHFLEKLQEGVEKEKSLAPETLDAMMRYGWPGNIRELSNEIERLLALAGPMREIPPSLLSDEILRAHEKKSAYLKPRKGKLAEVVREVVEEVEKEMILEALKKHRWNKTRVAQDLGVSRRNLIRKVAQYGLDRRK
jgi:transcriptional regulator with GAF, ATPase, and Fis domain